MATKTEPPSSGQDKLRGASATASSSAPVLTRPREPTAAPFESPREDTRSGGRRVTSRPAVPSRGEAGIGKSRTLAGPQFQPRDFAARVDRKCRAAQ
ncbi:hypothetical protein MTO96_014194 [Rhipicephalus appendiculatus]